MTIIIVIMGDGADDEGGDLHMKKMEEKNKKTKIKDGNSTQLWYTQVRHHN